MELKPIVRIIDDWVTNRRLALILEAKVGKGSLLVSGVDLKNDMENRPEARQLLRSLVHHMKSPGFDPIISFTTKNLRRIVKIE